MQFRQIIYPRGKEGLNEGKSINVPAADTFATFLDNLGGKDMHCMFRLSFFRSNRNLSGK